MACISWNTHSLQWLQIYKKWSITGIGPDYDIKYLQAVEIAITWMEQSTSMDRIWSWQYALTNCVDCHCMNGGKRHEQDSILVEGTHILWILELHEWSSQNTWLGSNPCRAHLLPVEITISWRGQSVDNAIAQACHTHILHNKQCTQVI